MTSEQWSNYPLPRQYIIDSMIGITIPHPVSEEMPAPESIIFDPRKDFNVTLADLPELEAYDTGTRFMSRNFGASATEYPAMAIGFRLKELS